MDPEVDTRTDFGVSTSPSYSAVTGLVLPCEEYKKLWIYWEMTSGFSVSWYASAVRVRVRIRVFGQGFALVSSWFWCPFHCRVRIYGVWARIALVSAWSWWSFARCVPCCRSQALMPCVMASMDQRYLFMVVHTPVVWNDICLWFRLHSTVESPQLQFFFLFVVIPVVAQMQILMVLHHRVSPAAVHCCAGCCMSVVCNNRCLGR